MWVPANMLLPLVACPIAAQTAVTLATAEDIAIKGRWTPSPSPDWDAAISMANEPKIQVCHIGTNFLYTT
jgi:hypothetical protein